MNDFGLIQINTNSFRYTSKHGTQLTALQYTIVQSRDREVDNWTISWVSHTHYQAKIALSQL